MLLVKIGKGKLLSTVIIDQHIMKKEIIIAIVVGVLLGLAITYGVYLSRSAQSNNQQTNVDETIATDDDQINQNQLTIHQPLDGAVFDDAKITVAGTSLADNFIVVIVNNTETITQADESGNFSTSIKLASGGNLLSVHAIDELGVETKVERMVILDDDSLQINKIAEASESAKASPSAEVDDN